MSYHIQIAESAEKSLGKIPKKDRERIIERIDSLSENPRPEGHIKLQGTKKLCTEFDLEIIELYIP